MTLDTDFQLYLIGNHLIDPKFPYIVGSPNYREEKVT